MGKTKRYIALVLLSASIIFIGYFLVRSEFIKLVSSFSVGFLAYLYLAFYKEKFSLNTIVFLGIALRFSMLFFAPNLSDDYHRFVWDGNAVIEGENPYLKVPEETVLDLSERDLDTYQQLNSKGFFTIYPPVLQSVFGLSAFLSFGNYTMQVIWLKVFILLAEIGSILVLIGLFRLMKLADRNVIWYALNPFVIVELTGNIHFEAYMIFFVLLSWFLLFRKKIMYAGAALGLAVCAKIIPLIFFPFVLNRIGFKKFLLFGLSGAVVIVLLFSPFNHPMLLGNFTESLSKYYSYFEFNGSLYNLLKPVFGHELSKAGIFSVLTASGLVIYFLLDNKRDLKSLGQSFMWSYFIYLLCATTIHPWYLMILPAFGMFYNWHFTVWWSFLVCFSYITYVQTPYEQNYMVILSEYILLLSFIGMDLIRKGYGWKKGAILRAKVKVDRIAGYLPENQPILEVGCGNGAVAYSLERLNYNVTTLDIRNKSFFKEIEPVLADGISIPFPDNHFDTVQLLTMLHHTPDPELIIREAARVGKRLVIMEDIYKNKFQQYLTYFTDSIVNLEFFGHPHTNKKDEEWRELFKNCGLRVVAVKKHQFLLFFTQITYHLEKD